MRTASKPTPDKTAPAGNGAAPVDAPMPPRFDLAALDRTEAEVKKERTQHAVTLEEARINLNRCDGSLALLKFIRDHHDFSPPQSSAE